MKCEIKMAKNEFKSLIIYTITHQKQKVLIWIKAVCVAIPVMLINAMFTPKSCFVAIGALLVFGLLLYILCHRDCKTLKA